MYTPIVFDLSEDDTFPATGQILIAVYESEEGRFVTLAYRETKWDIWGAPLLPSNTE